MALSFAISEWSGWQSEVTSDICESTKNLTVSESPDVKIIPPMLRRRLNLLGRACASEVLKHTPENTDIPIVYCSQHGDIQRTYHVLKELTDQQPVSPMHFSLAVHNAICGVLSIQTNNQANISSIAAGQEGIIPLLLEALGILQSGAPEVLCVICDVPLPDIYKDDKSQPAVPYAVSFIVTGDEGILLELENTQQKASDNDYQSPVNLLKFLNSEQTQFDYTHNQQRWQLKKITV